MTEYRGWSKSRTFCEACRYAWRGMVFGVKAERNMRIQLTVCVVVLISAVLLALPPVELAVIILVSALVLALEMVNTAAEELADVVKPEFHERVRHFKDIAAGAVLLSSLAAIFIGWLLLGPPLVALVIG